jgi:hypothetical protein
MKISFLVLARDATHVKAKIKELQNLNVPYLVVCGSRLKQPNVVYREPKGKYDAINFGFSHIPNNVNVVALNDVDTEICNFDLAVKRFFSENADLLFVRVSVREGPQRSFYRILDFIRRRIPITASGELMLIKYELLSKIIPICACKAEDSYILFKALQLKGKVVFCEDCFVVTDRTKTLAEEERYKSRTTAGIYQALKFSRPPYKIRLFYLLLPFFAPLLLVVGKKGYSWFRGILQGYFEYLRGDMSGVWS